MPITFYPDSGVYTVNTTVAFRAEMNGTDVMCEISETALQDHFGAKTHNGPELVAAFNTHRDAIEAVARKALPLRIPLGRCLLLTSDF